MPEEQRFKLDDVAEFDDGLVMEVAGTVADKASKTDQGAEATDGQIVIASIRIENDTKEPYEAEGVLIGATYGDGKDAQIIIDKTDELQSSFTKKIKPKAEGIATVGFAVPWTELEKVTIIVDPNPSETSSRLTETSRSKIPTCDNPSASSISPPSPAKCDTAKPCPIFDLSPPAARYIGTSCPIAVRLSASSNGFD